MTDGPQLDWSITRDGAKLRVQFHLTNTTKHRIYIVDKLVVPAAGNKFNRTDQVTVMNDEPNTVMFALAAVSSDRPSATLYTPTFRPVEAGKKIDGRFELPFPLVAWNPVGGANAIAGTPKAAVFMLQYFEGEPPAWKKLTSDDKAPLQVPDGHSPVMLRVGPKPLP